MHIIIAVMGICPKSEQFCFNRTYGTVKQEIFMARDQKCRKICCIPKNKVFVPEHKQVGTVVLTLDEIEAVRLSDLEGLDQDTCAKRMEISRATYQRILRSARKAVADALVNGKAIEMRGGRYTVADNHCQGETSCANCRFAEKKKG
jgi:predicted DNA-binding protein (UPF0251 family)